MNLSRDAIKSQMRNNKNTRKVPMRTNRKCYDNGHLLLESISIIMYLIITICLYVNETVGMTVT